MEKNIEKWQQIYAQGLAGSFMQYPNETLVTLFFQNRTRFAPGSICLDYGFGSGANSEFLIKHVGELCGIEIAQSSVDIVSNRLKLYSNFKPECFTTQPDWSALQDKFDIVVAWQVLCYNDRQSLQGAISLLRDSLRPGGVLIATLTSQEDVKAKFAKQVAPSTFVIDERIPHQAGCQIYAVASEGEFLTFFSDFKVVDSGRYLRSSSVTGQALAEYFVVATKA